MNKILNNNTVSQVRTIYYFFNLDEAEEGSDHDTEEPKSVLVEEKKCQFLVAAGLGVQVPSNAYLRNTFGSLKCDIHPGTQDITVEERKSDKKLLRKESTPAVNEFGTIETPRKRKKKKKTLSKMSMASYVEDEDGFKKTDTENNTESGEKGTMDLIGDIAKRNLSNEHLETENGAKIMETVEKPVKKKKLKKRQSSNFEDMLHMSDDSITRDEVEEVKIYKQKGQKRVLVRKITNNISEEIKPEDSLDEDQDEGLNTKPVKTDTLDIMQNELKLSKEETMLIKDVAQKKLKDIEENGLTKVESDKVTFHLGEEY